MNARELQTRTKQFALRVLKVIAALPETAPGRVVANQLSRSGTSVGANYRAVCRARSRKDFINKLGVVIEEADESAYWLEIICESELLDARQIAPLLQEANELVAIFTAACKTARKRDIKPV